MVFSYDKGKSFETLASGKHFYSVLYTYVAIGFRMYSKTKLLIGMIFNVNIDVCS